MNTSGRKRLPSGYINVWEGKRKGKGMSFALLLMVLTKKKRSVGEASAVSFVPKLSALGVLGLKEKAAEAESSYSS